MLLIDFDIIAYRCAASCEPTKLKPFLEPLDEAYFRADAMMYKAVNNTGEEEYVGWLSGGENFRYMVSPTYKANRKDKPTPTHLADVQEMLICDWDAKFSVEKECDDMIAIAHKEGDIICSIDKDFLQIPGHHYNFITEKVIYVNDDEADLNFWKQFLIGDSSDNIEGVPGIGKVKADKILRPQSPRERELTVRAIYEEVGLDYAMNYKLLRLVRSEEEFEAVISESKGAKPTEPSGSEDLSPFSTINS